MFSRWEINLMFYDGVITLSVTSLFFLITFPYLLMMGALWKDDFFMPLCCCPWFYMNKKMTLQPHCYFPDEGSFEETPSVFQSCSYGHIEGVSLRPVRSWWGWFVWFVFFCLAFSAHVPNISFGEWTGFLLRTDVWSFAEKPAASTTAKSRSAPMACLGTDAPMHSWGGEGLPYVLGFHTQILISWLGLKMTLIKE